MIIMMRSCRTYQRLGSSLLRCTTKQAVCSTRSFQASNFRDVVVTSSVRTPIGSFGGELSSLSAVDLATIAIKESVHRSGLPPEVIMDSYMGIVFQHGMGMMPGRQAILKAGLPDSVEGSTVNKACASGMKAVMMGAQTVMLGVQDIVLAGGMESLSNVPLIIRRQVPYLKDIPLLDCLVHDGYLDPILKIFMGDCADHLNKKMGISRQEQDEFALRSYDRSAAAWRDGRMTSSVVPVTVKHKGETRVITEDEEYKKLKRDKISTLKPAFSKEGSVTAANASKVNDGACAMILMSADAAVKHNVKPEARIITFADAAMGPIDFPLSPAITIDKCLKQSGVKKDDVTMWEINEAFSSVVIATERLCDLDPEKVNIHGGAVSLGHPVGASGARLISHLAHNLEKGQIGVASICNGLGGASAVMLEGL